MVLVTVQTARFFFSCCFSTLQNAMACRLNNPNIESG